MDLGAEAMGAYKAQQGGCTYIQVRARDIADQDRTTDHPV